jgi:hypothetical protein
MDIIVGPGCILTESTVEPNGAYGTLGTNTQPCMRLGTIGTSTAFALTAPTTPGQSIDYLICATFQEADGDPVILNYVNATSPSTPYSGPANSGDAQNTERTATVGLQLVAGTPATAGSQTLPATPSGWSPLWQITVPYGATTITSGNITAIPGAPFVNFTLQSLTPGFSRRVVLNTPGSGNWTVPNGVTLLRATVIGGGGGGGGSTGSYAGGGGGAGGFASGTFAVTPGALIPYLVGAGGAGGAASASAPNGGGTTLSTWLLGGGGQGGQYVSAGNTFGGTGGVGSGGELYGNGGSGDDGQNGSVFFGGCGGASMLGGGGRASTASGGVVNSAANGQAPGSGGGGVYDTAGTGGTGANGIIILEY